MLLPILMHVLKLSQISILKFNSWYLCQISLQIMLLPIPIRNINNLWNSQHELRTIPWRLRWSRRGRATTTLQCNIQTKWWKPQCWEKANGSFRHHNNCGSTRSGKHERARTTHIGRPIDDNVERKPIPAIVFRFSSSGFLRESNHDEVPGTDHDERVQQLSSTFHHWPLEASSWDFKTVAQFL